MKYLVAFAVLSVATAAVTPITLPQAPSPQVVYAEPAALPQAALPQAQAYVPRFEPVDIRPLMVPQEVIEALKRAEVTGEATFDAVRVVEISEDAPVKAEELSEVPSEESGPFDAVKVVEYADLIAPLSKTAEVEGVKVVTLEDITALLADAPVDAVKVVEVAEDAGAPVMQDVTDANVVKIINSPFRAPGKVFDNPILR